MRPLWPHQEQAVEAVFREWNQPGIRRTLVACATGSGKSRIGLHVLDELRKSGKMGRCLFLSHLRELVEQPINNYREDYPELTSEMGAVQGENDECDARVVCGTVQTLSSPARLERVLAAGPFSHIIVDEAHHFLAIEWHKVIKSLNNPYMLAMTATPRRTDGAGLIKIIQSVAFRFPISDAVAAGVLVPMTPFGFRLPITLDALHDENGNGEDSAHRTAGDLLKTENVLEIIYTKWMEFTQGTRKTIGFCASVGQAYRTAEYFRERGVRAIAIDGGTPKDERAQIARDYQSGVLQAVFNQKVWTEGVDFPETSCIIRAAPTSSDLVWIQSVGRGLRTCPRIAKENCVVLDFVPKDSRDIVMAGDILGVPRDVKKAQERAEKAGMLISAFSMSLFGMVAAIDPSEICVQMLRYMTKRSDLAWSLDGNLAIAGLSDTAMLVIVLPDSERLTMAEETRRVKWSARHERLYQWLQMAHVLIIKKDEHKQWQSGTLGSYRSLEQAQEAANEAAGKWSLRILSDRKSGWRKDPATIKLLGYMRSLGITPPKPCSKGLACQLIDSAIAKRAAAEWLARERKAIWNAKGEA